MLTRKSGILALILGVSVFGAACEDKNDLNTPTPIEIVVVNIVPETVAPITQGQSVQLFANVTGNTNQAVTWTSSNTNVADVNSAGLVTTTGTGKVAGTTTIRAVSQADNTKSDAVAITVMVGTPVTPDTPPNITIQSVTQNGTNLPVNPGNVAGVIDVTANVDVPANAAGRVTFRLVNAAGAEIPGTLGAVRCQQDFTAAGASGNDVSASAVPVPVVCSINTAKVTDPEGLAEIQNGTYRIQATVVVGNQTASATSQPYVFNNADFLFMVVQTQSMTRAADAVGLAFYGGDVVVHVRPAIYSTSQADPLGSVSSMQVSLMTSGAGSFAANTGSWYPTCGTLNEPVTTCAPLTKTVTAARQGTTNLYVATFPRATAVQTGNGVGSLEDRGGVTIAPANVVTAGGSTFPICSGGLCGPATFGVAFQPTPGSTAVPVQITAQNPLRIDNLAPRVTRFDITDETLGCAPLTACYVNAGFTFGQGTPTAGVANGTGTFATTALYPTNGYRNVDFGSDRQTTTFDIVTASNNTAVATNVTSPANVPETSTSNVYVLRANVTDANGNTASVFAGETATAPTSAATTTGAQRFGVDLTRPIVLPLSATECTAQGGTLSGEACVVPPFVNQTDTNEADVQLIFRIRDASTPPAGPSGFRGTGTPPVEITVRVANAANPAGVAATGTALCAALGDAQSQCTVTVPDAGAMGYYLVTTTIRDASFPNGNQSTPAIEVRYLDDEVAPIVAGVTAPSTITPNASVTFAADMSDNVELGDNLVTLGYPVGGAPNYYAHAPRQSLGDFGSETLCASTLAGTAGCASGAFTFQAGTMPVSLQMTAGGAPVLGGSAYSNAVNFAVRDMAGRQLNTVCAAPGVGSDGLTTQGPTAPNGSCVVRENNNIQPNIVAGNGGAAPFDFTTLGAFTFVQNAIARTGTGGSTVTLQAEARGPQGTFENPFPQGVNFYTLDASGRWIVVAGTVGLQVFDDDILNVRRWIYTLTTTSTAVPADITVRAVGIRNTTAGTAGLIASPDQPVVVVPDSNRVR